MLKILKSGCHLNLLYRGSRDGFKPKVFHQKVDGKGATITILNVNENISGGYTDIEMSSQEGFKKGNWNSFIFKLNDEKSYNVFKC